jgi:hypothetical protein
MEIVTRPTTTRVLTEASISRKIDRGSWTDRLLSIAVAIVFVLLCRSVLYLPKYQNFNPDEARLVISMEHLAEGWFDENPLTGTHLGSQVQYFLIPKLTTVTITKLRMVAAVFFVLTALYVIWLARAYALFSKTALLVLLLLMGTNAGLNYYGNWGVFDYSQRVLQSVFLLHALLFLHQRQLNLPTRVLALVLFAFCLLTVGYSALMVPIAVLVGVVVLFRRPAASGDTPLPVKSALKRGLILIIPVLVVGLITLKYAAHPEFKNPRPTIKHLFFPLSDHPKTAGGLAAFVGAKTLSFVISTFAPIGSGASLMPFPAPTSRWEETTHSAMFVLSLLAVIGFMRGLIGSLFQRTRDPVRFVIGAYVALVLVSLVGLAVLGVYAFGDVRYALFMYVPLLVVAVYGLRDIAKSIRRRLPASLASRMKRVAAPVLAGVVLVMSVGFSEVMRSEKRRYNDEFTNLVTLIRTDPSPLVFYDTFAEWNFIVLGINEFPNKRAFLFDFIKGVRLESFQKFIASREDVLWITYHLDRDEPVFAPYVAELEATHDRVEDRSFGVLWRIIRWKKRTASPE